jgi:hypothetical protein
MVSEKTDTLKNSSDLCTIKWIEKSLENHNKRYTHIISVNSFVALERFLLS